MLLCWVYSSFGSYCNWRLSLQIFGICRDPMEQLRWEKECLSRTERHGKWSYLDGWEWAWSTMKYNRFLKILYSAVGKTCSLYHCQGTIFFRLRSLSIWMQITASQPRRNQRKIKTSSLSRHEILHLQIISIFNKNSFWSWHQIMPLLSSAKLPHAVLLTNSLFS